jgi:maleate isomerase
VTIPELIPLSFDTDDGFGARARLGLIVLESDQTIEAEARMLDLDGVDIYHSRIPNALEVTPETLTDMEARLPIAAALLPSEFEFDAIGYGCTSAATLIGAEGVAAGIHAAHPGIVLSGIVVLYSAAGTVQSELILGLQQFLSSDSAGASAASSDSSATGGMSAAPSTAPSGTPGSGAAGSSGDSGASMPGAASAPGGASGG